MIFMHKDKPIAEVSVNSGRFSVYKLLSNQELPVGTMTQTRQLLELSLSNWYSSRAIPGLRQSLDRIERALGCSVFDALVRSMGVSLTDCYWFRPDGMESLTWKDVNYHDNGFSEDLAAVIIHGADDPVVDFRLPDLTTDGALQKGWVLLDGMPVLVKFGDFGDHAMGKNLLSANEVAAYRIAQEMQIDCVEYFPLKIGNTEAVVSGCPCFITDPNSEFVSAIQIGRKMNRVGSLSLYHTLSGMRDFNAWIPAVDTGGQNCDSIRTLGSFIPRRILLDNRARRQRKRRCGNFIYSGKLQLFGGRLRLRLAEMERKI